MENNKQYAMNKVVKYMTKLKQNINAQQKYVYSKKLDQWVNVMVGGVHCNYNIENFQHDIYNTHAHDFLSWFSENKFVSEGIRNVVLDEIQLLLYNSPKQFEAGALCSNLIPIYESYRVYANRKSIHETNRKMRLYMNTFLKLIAYAYYILNNHYESQLEGDINILYGKLLSLFVPPIPARKHNLTMLRKVKPYICTMGSEDILQHVNEPEYLQFFNWFIKNIKKDTIFDIFTKILRCKYNQNIHCIPNLKMIHRQELCNILESMFGDYNSRHIKKINNSTFLRLIAFSYYYNQSEEDNMGPVYDEVSSYTSHIYDEVRKPIAYYLSESLELYGLLKMFLKNDSFTI
jgi:hypothetical protein